MGEDDKYDIHFVVIKGWLLWQPINFGAKIGLTDTTFILCAGDGTDVARCGLQPTSFAEC